MNHSNFKRFLLLWMGQLISAIGGGLTSFGLGVYVFEKTGSVAGMALVTLLGFLPTLLLSVPAGVLADRYDRRLLMMLGDGFSGIGVLYILICMIRGEASLTQICIGVLLADVIAKYSGISVGRGAGMVIVFAGVALVIVSVSILFIKEIKILEEKTGGKIICMMCLFRMFRDRRLRKQ